MGRSTCFCVMKVLHVCLSLTATISGIVSPEALESDYQKLYKKIASFLYAHPVYKLTFSFEGQIFSWLVKKHPEFIRLLKELLSRKQIEVLGGGYYNPVLPLLLPIDRNGQIEMYTSELSAALGKRPRGMTVYGSIWDNSVVPNLYASGMEYVLLDTSIIPPAKRCALPLLLTEHGKSIKVLPVYRDFLPENEENAGSYFASVRKSLEKTLKKIGCALEEERVICLNLNTAQFSALLDSGTLEDFYETALEESNSVSFTLPQEYLHKHSALVPAYIAPGIQSDIAQWGINPYTPSENKSTFPVTIYDFLSTYNRNHALYDRTLYISTLVANCHGDKSRKKLAREKLWQAQTGKAFVCNPEGIFATNAIRQNAYRALTETEKIVRECLSGKREFKESVTSYDYNADGHDEYVCQMKSFDACISLKGALITELDIMHNTGNYADNLKRIEKFDKVDDNYERGLFVEHLFTRDEFADYKKGLPTGNGIFSQVQFSQVGFDKKRHEIKLLGTGEFDGMAQPVSLRKHYIINSNGFTVQYILKNESPLALKAELVVESNFAQTDFTSTDCNSYNAEIISREEKHELSAQTKPETLTDVSFVQITDASNDISFVYELNENADVTCMPLYFRRPQTDNAILQIAGTTFVSSLCWNVDLSAGMEMEKTINFTIITPKKRKGKRK